MANGIVKLIQDLINEHGSGSILRERLLLLKDELGKVEKERSDLQQKLAEAHKQITELGKELEKERTVKKFVEHRGALFKRNDSGGYDVCVYCPSCRRPMGSIQGLGNYNCKRCKIVLDFAGNDLPNVMEELPQLE